MKNSFFLLIFLSVFFLAACGDDDEGSDNTKGSLRISSTDVTVPNGAGSITVHVVSNTSWTVEAQDAWLTSDKAEGTGNVSVKISYADNTTSRRTGVVKFSAKGVSPVELKVTQTELTFTNPIAGIPDPWIIKQGDYYYFCKADGKGINIARSSKLTNFPTTSRVWTAPTDQGSDKPWNVAEIWAPELHYIDGRWYIYYAAGRPQSESNSYNYQRSGVLRAKTNDPMGAWEDMGMLYTGDNYTNGVVPTAANTNYAIDLAVFTLNKQMYAVWSGYPVTNEDGNQLLYIAKMENPHTISSSRAVISKPDKSWEVQSGKLNEGPAFLKNKEKGKFFVVYSCT